MNVAKFCSLAVYSGVLLSGLFASTLAYAGFVEVGASGSYRKTTIDKGTFDENESLTGSMTYYFDESSATELSYTNGVSKRAMYPNLPNGSETTMSYATIGLDFIYTFGDHEATFRPYLKGGVSYIIEKQIVSQFRDPQGNWYAPSYDRTSPSFVPSAGAGFRIGMTKSVSLKVGVDVSSSNPINQQPFTLDYAGRVGIGFMF